jgi:hypothetical protein
MEKERYARFFFPQPAPHHHPSRANGDDAILVLVELEGSAIVAVEA